VSAPVRRGGPGKDPRVVTLRGALESLIESLDATVRVARWQAGDGEPIPEPLRWSAEQLQDRLGSATRLAAGRFVGAPEMVNASDAIKEAVQELDAAFLAYRRRVGRVTTDRDEAAIVLDGVVGRIKLGAHRWG